MAGESKAPAFLYVTAERVVAYAKAGGVLELLKGAVVPESVSEKSLQHLKDLGFVSETSPFDGQK